MTFLSMDIKTREFLPGLALIFLHLGGSWGLLGSAESKGSELSADRAGNSIATTSRSAVNSHSRPILTAR